MSTSKKLYDFNSLERMAADFTAAMRFDDALQIYYYMADGDSSLDAGWLATKIAECYERKTQIFAAKYWHSRAVEENPEARASSRGAAERLAREIEKVDLLAMP